jgi:hypothetical protein
MGRRLPVVTLFFLCLIFLQNAAESVIIPTKGTFEGVYHIDRWGNRFFEDYIVDATLRSVLDWYNGKYIKMTLTDAVQPNNPGPAVIYGCRNIVLVEKPPLDIRLSTDPGQLINNAPIQLIIEVINVGNVQITMPKWHQLSVKITGAVKEKSTEYMHTLGNYRIIRLQDGERLISTTLEIGRILQSERNNPNFVESDALWGKTIEPGASIKLTHTFKNGLPSGEYEIEVVCPFIIHGHTKSTRNWILLDVL